MTINTTRYYKSAFFLPLWSLDFRFYIVPVNLHLFSRNGTFSYNFKSHLQELPDKSELGVVFDLPSTIWDNRCPHSVHLQFKISCYDPKEVKFLCHFTYGQSKIWSHKNVHSGKSLSSVDIDRRAERECLRMTSAFFITHDIMINIHLYIALLLDSSQNRWTCLTKTSSNETHLVYGIVTSNNVGSKFKVFWNFFIFPRSCQLQTWRVLGSNVLINQTCSTVSTPNNKSTNLMEHDR